MHGVLPPGLLADFVVDGLIAGVGSVVIFLPQIVLLFTLLGQGSVGTLSFRELAGAGAAVVLGGVHVTLLP